MNSRPASLPVSFRAAGSGGGETTGRAIVQVLGTGWLRHQTGGRVASFAAEFPEFPGWVGARITRVAIAHADARPARMVGGAPVAPVVEPAAVIGALAVARHGGRPHSVPLPMLRLLNPCGSSFVHGGHTEPQNRRHTGGSRRSRYLACLVCHAVFLVIGESTLASTNCVFHHSRRMLVATRSSANIDVGMKESISTEVES
jgi:hypothetical protein